jgi:hypothetical protein
VYPAKWSELTLVPEARSELLLTVRDIRDWNKPNSSIRVDGADDALDFLFDVYEMDVDCDHLVGKLIFKEELPYLRVFVTSFHDFLSQARNHDPGLDAVNQMTLPTAVETAADQLYDILSQSGVPTSA